MLPGRLKEGREEDRDQLVNQSISDLGKSILHKVQMLRIQRRLKFTSSKCGMFCCSGSEWRRLTTVLFRDTHSASQFAYLNATPSRTNGMHQPLVLMRERQMTPMMVITASACLCQPFSFSYHSAGLRSPLSSLSSLLSFSHSGAQLINNCITPINQLRAAAPTYSTKTDSDWKIEKLPLFNNPFSCSLCTH